MSQFKNVKIPLNILVDTDKLLLVGIRPLMEYANGKATENQIGYRLEVVETSRFTKFPVKLLETNPAITEEMLEKSTDRIYVRFSDCYAKPYVRDGRVDYSISASHFDIIKRVAVTAAERK